MEACAVCNQFFFEDRKSPIMHELHEAPSGTFTLLVPEPTAKPLHALLKREYDVSDMFSQQDLVAAGLTAKRLGAVLLSSLGVIRHEAGCLDQDLCECRSKLRFCKTCHNSLKNGRRPRLSIANGNYIGSGPEVCLDMTDASRRCVRPIQQFGRLCSYETKDIPHGGTTLTGHSYSTRLHTPFLSTSLPVKPAQVPCRVLFASAFASKKAIVRRAELAMVLRHPIFLRA
jgi:hypothetical protein